MVFRTKCGVLFLSQGIMDLGLAWEGGGCQSRSDGVAGSQSYESLLLWEAFVKTITSAESYC